MSPPATDPRAPDAAEAADTAPGNGGAIAPAGSVDPAASYAEAVEELEAILRSLDRNDVDVDLLTAHVGRAADLIRFCRDRLDGARVDVERILVTLDPEGERRSAPDDNASHLPHAPPA